MLMFMFAIVVGKLVRVDVHHGIGALVGVDALLMWLNCGCFQHVV